MKYLYYCQSYITKPDIGYLRAKNCENIFIIFITAKVRLQNQMPFLFGHGVWSLFFYKISIMSMYLKIQAPYVTCTFVMHERTFFFVLLLSVWFTSIIIDSIVLIGYLFRNSCDVYSQRSRHVTSPVMLCLPTIVATEHTSIEATTALFHKPRAVADDFPAQNQDAIVMTKTAVSCEVFPAAY